MPEPVPSHRPTAFKVVPGSREQFFKWAKEHVTSPTTGQSMKPKTTRTLLDVEDVVRSVSAPLRTEAIGVRPFKPLAKLIKDGREAEVSEVWRRASKLAEAAGQDTPGQAIVKQALAAHNKALGIKPPVSKQSLQSHQHKVEANFDWLVRHNTPDENRAPLRRLVERLKAEHQWARGELAS